MQRYFIDKECLISSNVAQIEGDDFHHMTRVMRMEPGDQVYAVIGDDVWLAEIVRIKSDCLDLHLLEQSMRQAEPTLRVTLIQGLPKGEKIDLVIRQASELGVSRLVIFQAKRSVAKIPEHKLVERLARYRKLAKEASEQSQRASIVQVHYASSLSEAVALARDDSLVVPYEAQDQGLPSLKQVLHDMRSQDSRESVADQVGVSVVVGPEGGFDLAEIDELMASGGRLCTLGPRILRTETVGVVISAILFYEFDQMVVAK